MSASSLSFFSFRLFLQAICLLIVALILGSVHRVVYCIVGAERCCGQGRVMRRQLLVDAVQARMALSCLTRLAASVHIHGYRAVALHIAHQIRKQFRILAVLRFRLVGLRRQLFLRVRRTMFFCGTLAQLPFSPLLFSSLSLGLSTKVLRTSGLHLFLSWSLNSSASVESSFLFAATVRADCLPAGRAIVGDGMYITQGIAGPHSLRKESAVDFDLRWRRAQQGRMSRAVVLEARRHVIRLSKKLTFGYT